MSGDGEKIAITTSHSNNDLLTVYVCNEESVEIDSCEKVVENKKIAEIDMSNDGNYVAVAREDGWELHKYKHEAWGEIGGAIIEANPDGHLLPVLSGDGSILAVQEDIYNEETSKMEMDIYELTCPTNSADCGGGM